MAYLSQIKASSKVTGIERIVVLINVDREMRG